MRFVVIGFFVNNVLSVLWFVCNTVQKKKKKNKRKSIQQNINVNVLKLHGMWRQKSTRTPTCRLKAHGLSLKMVSTGLLLLK